MVLEFLVCDLADDGQYQDHAKTHTRLWRVRQGCRRLRPRMALHGQLLIFTVPWYIQNEVAGIRQAVTTASRHIKLHNAHDATAKVPVRED